MSNGLRNKAHPSNFLFQFHYNHPKYNGILNRISSSCLKRIVACMYYYSHIGSVKIKYRLHKTITFSFSLVWLVVAINSAFMLCGNLSSAIKSIKSATDHSYLQGYRFKWGIETLL